jgi:hypothetical protein
LIRDHIATWNISSEIHYEVKEMYIIVSSLGAISKETIKDIDTFIRHEDKLVRGKGISKEAKLWSKRFVIAAVKGSFRIWINAPHGLIIKDKGVLKN